MKKILTTLLILTLTVSMNAFCSFAYADTGLQGEGTEENPYLLYTRADMFCVNNDVNASYKLMDDIDLEKQEFTPIGNAEAGAFAGTFDGNGHTISNLKVSSGKYAALFGCNEGTVKNIVLKNIDVSGTRYAAGVVAENAEAGSIADCKVLSGKVQGVDGLNPLNIGGICGLNGGKMEGVFENRASVKSEEISSIAGGIAGKSTADIELSDVRNYGDITGDCAGGLIGYGANVTITGGQNVGDISNFLLKDGNEATLSRTTYGDAGGILGHSIKANIEESYNAGKIAGTKYGAGITARTQEAELNKCYNSAAITMKTTPHSYDYRPRTKGLIANVNATGSTIIKNSYNSGNLQQFYSNAGASAAGTPLEQPVLAGGSVFSSYESGIVTGQSIPVMRGENSFMISHPDASGYTENEMRTQETFVGWEFGTTWMMNAQRNSGYPTLVCDVNPLQLNYSNKIICEGETLQLIAYKNNQRIDNVKWIVSDGNVSVSNKGVIAAGSLGLATITAIDEEGNKANCNIYVIKGCEDLTLKKDVYNYNYTYKYGYYHYQSLEFTFIGQAYDYITKITSEDESILKLRTRDTFYTMKEGKTNLKVELASGLVKTFPITITNYATEIYISNAPKNITRGEQYQLNVKIFPDPTSSKITWESSNEAVASVDSTGSVTAKEHGSVTITAKTDNGLSAACTIAVITPATSLTFEKNIVELYVGESEQLNLTVLPIDTTDKVTYTAYAYSDAAIVNNDGKVTAQKIGSTTITATASNGATATCTVKVIDYPTIVTGVTLDQTKYDMKTGEVFKLNATIVPSNATDKSITWASTDSSVASVSEVGTVSAVGAGKAVITATSGNGVIAACEVTVTGVASTNLSRIYIPEIFDAKSEIINVPVMIEHNPGISFINFSVSYDKEKMEPLEINNGSLFESVMGSIDAENGKIKLIFSSDTDITKSGVLAKIKFKRKNMEEDITDLSVSYYPDGVMNKKQKRIALKMSDGRLNAYRSTICGDVDENRKVDFADALYFKRYLANWSKYQDVSLKTANLDSDNEITPADLIILERHIAGWTGYQNIPQNQS